MTIPTIPIQMMVETANHKADIYINGDITRGFQWFGLDMGQDTDVAYQDVVEALGDLPDEVTDVCVHINSYGGEVAEGVAIYNALKAHRANVTTVCEGFACSIASVIFMAGATRVMRASSLLMLHNASMPAHGDANAHRKAAEDLDVITELSKTAYLSHATESLTREKLDDAMDAETWVTPETALEWGLATEIDEGTAADEPIQSARAMVADALVNPKRIPIAQVNLTRGQVDEIFTRLEDLEQTIAKQQGLWQNTEVVPLAATIDATTICADTLSATDSDRVVVGERRKYNERFGRIFRQLAIEK